MDNNYMNEILQLYFKGYHVDEALKITKSEGKQGELKKMAQAWDNKIKEETVQESRGWRYQQAKFI